MSADATFRYSKTLPLPSWIGSALLHSKSVAVNSIYFEARLISPKGIGVICCSRLVSSMIFMPMNNGCLRSTTNEKSRLVPILVDQTGIGLGWSGLKDASYYVV